MKPIIFICPDMDDLSLIAAEFVVATAQAAVDQHGRFVTALSGGGTPQKLYQRLSQAPYCEKMPWAQTIVFWGDERLVPPADPGSSYRMTADLLLDQVPLPPANIYRALGEATPDTAVADYSAKLAAVAGPAQKPWPRFDLILLGLGSDGHTASLFPGKLPPADTDQPVLAVTAAYDGRPAHRLTLTPLVFNDAHNILFLAAGQKKAQALYEVLEGKRQPQKWPAQIIQPRDGSTTWMVDEAAAALLTNSALSA